MKANPAIEAEVDRMLAEPLPEIEDSFALHGVQMLIAHAALANGGIQRPLPLMEHARKVLKAVEASKEPTSIKSRLVTEREIKPAWFANHLWRALILRAGAEMALVDSSRLWTKQLKALCKLYVKDGDQGWTSRKRLARHFAEDLHSNLMVLVTLRLAQEAPEGLIGSNARKLVVSSLRSAPKLLRRLVSSYPMQMSSGRLSLALSLGSMSPEAIPVERWRAGMTKGITDLQERSGAFNSRTQVWEDLGILAGLNRAESRAAETAMTLIGLSGGLIAPERALSGKSMEEIGRVIYSQVIVQVSVSRNLAGTFDERVKFALEDGCNFVARSQGADGSFPGRMASYPGQQALCLLALLHGGYDRDDPVIAKGLAYLEPRMARLSRVTYDGACILMFLQKYYQPEQRQAGVLKADTPDEFKSARKKVLKLIPERHRKVIQQIVSDMNDAHVGGNGGWGYRKLAERTGNSHSDNSCSQYALLGYKSASLLGAKVRVDVFSREVTRLLEQYWEDPNQDEITYLPGDWDLNKKRTGVKSKIRPGGWGYNTRVRQFASLQMTAAGISSLAVCLDEIKVRGRLQLGTEHKIRRYMTGALAFVESTYYQNEKVREGIERQVKSGWSDGWGLYYNLYSVERACSLAGRRTLGKDVDWYRVGADIIIGQQAGDGSWTGGKNRKPVGGAKRTDMVNTCMSILFLRRASLPVITEHKKRDKQPKSPITPGPEKK